MRRALLVLACALVLSCAGGSTPPASSTAEQSGLATTVTTDGDRLPSGWVPEQMLPRELDAHDRAPGAAVIARVLLWQVKEDERPLYVEQAIVWASVRDADGPSHWLLVKVFRHPRDHGSGMDVWRLSIVADSPVIAMKRFDVAPTSADVSAFLDASDWREGTTGFRVLGAGTCRNAWQLSVGAAPTAP